MHSCEEDLICKCSNEKIPYFNAPVFLKDKSQIGKVDDIFGPINEFVSFLFSIISQHLSIFSKFDFLTYLNEHLVLFGQTRSRNECFKF